MEFKPLENWYKINILLAGDSELIAVANNPLDKEEMIHKHHVPPDRTGVLLSMPKRICLLRKKDYEALKAKEDEILADRNHRESRAEGT